MLSQTCQLIFWKNFDFSNGSQKEANNVLQDSCWMESLPNWVEKTVIRKIFNKSFVQSLKFCDWKLFNFNKNVQLHYHRGKHFNSYF